MAGVEAGVGGTWQLLPGGGDTGVVTGDTWSPTAGTASTPWLNPVITADQLFTDWWLRVRLQFLAKSVATPKTMAVWWADSADNFFGFEIDGSTSSGDATHWTVEAGNYGSFELAGVIPSSSPANTQEVVLQYLSAWSTIVLLANDVVLASAAATPGLSDLLGFALDFESTNVIIVPSVVFEVEAGLGVYA